MIMIPFPSFYLALLCHIVLMLISLRATEKKQKYLLFSISGLQAVFLFLSWPLFCFFDSARIIETYTIAVAMMIPAIGFLISPYQFFIKGYSKNLAIGSTFLLLLGDGLSVYYAAELIAPIHC